MVCKCFGGHCPQGGPPLWKGGRPGSIPGRTS
jgi:hypothetical protein